MYSRVVLIVGFKSGDRTSSCVRTFFSSLPQLPYVELRTRINTCTHIFFQIRPVIVSHHSIRRGLSNIKSCCCGWVVCGAPRDSGP